MSESHTKMISIVDLDRTVERTQLQQGIKFMLCSFACFVSTIANKNVCIVPRMLKSENPI